MPKKQKIDKRLDKLFDNITPEETASGSKSKPKVEKEAPRPSAPQPVQSVPAVSTPEPSVPSTSKPKPSFTSEPAAPTEVIPQPTPTKTPAPAPQRQVKRHTSVLPPLPSETMFVQETQNNNTSAFAVNFQTGNQDWATLRVIDEASQREWTTDEQLLVRQVTDQLALALENARLFQETQEALDTTRARAEAENLINDIATAFLNVNDPARIDEEITRSLERVGRFLNVDRSYVFIFNDDGLTMDMTHEWHAENVEAHIRQFRNIQRSSLPYMMSFLNRMEAFIIPNVSDMPREGHIDRDEYQRRRIQSVMSVPVALQNQAVGFIGLDSVNKVNNWREEDLTTLRLFGQIAISAIERAKDQNALAKSEADLRLHGRRRFRCGWGRQIHAYRTYQPFSFGSTAG
jgi:GAF domain-containing protein